MKGTKQMASLDLLSARKTSVNEDDYFMKGGQSPTSVNISSSELAETSFLIINDSTNGVLSSQNKHFECTTDIGLKSTQEDRVLLAPEFFDSELALCAVFDGTSGDAASDFASKYLANFLCSTKEMQSLLTYFKFRQYYPNSQSKEIEHVAKLSAMALRKAFLLLDHVLLHQLNEQELHFTASTAVTALIWENLLTIAHLGDSRACTFRQNEDGSLHPEWLTVDHKPNHPEEHQRIVAKGGSLSWTHNKPYVRSPDFLEHQKGEHPKKLNFSRGFGGKDLKSYGFTADPEIKHFEILPSDKFVVLATDGLWDVLTPHHVGHIISLAHANGLSATDEIVKVALEEMPDQSIHDNISVIVITL